jgi:hypothetical protein
LASLELSIKWARSLRGRSPLALVTQDGQQPRDLAPFVGLFDVVFVGGTLQWKIATGPEWVRFAHQHGKLAHIGRVGTARRVAWAKRIGVDSIDSCLPLWSRENLNKFVTALNGPKQVEMPW